MSRIFGMNVFAAASAAMFIFFVTVSAGWSAEQTPSQNQDARPMNGCQERFQEMDADNDGKVTREEFMGVSHGRAYPEEMFDSIAQGKDSFTEKEFCAGKGRHGGRGSGKGSGKGN